jgi:hypothetical protein
MRETEMGLIKRKEEMQKEVMVVEEVQTFGSRKRMQENKKKAAQENWEIGMEGVEEWKKHQVEENKKKKIKGSIYYHACDYYHPCNAIFQPIDMPAVQPKRKRRVLLAIKND